MHDTAMYPSSAPTEKNGPCFNKRAYRYNCEHSYVQSCWSTSSFLKCFNRYMETLTSTKIRSSLTTVHFFFQWERRRPPTPSCTFCPPPPPPPSPRGIYLPPPMLFSIRIEKRSVILAEHARLVGKTAAANVYIFVQ